LLCSKVARFILWVARIAVVSKKTRSHLGSPTERRPLATRGTSPSAQRHASDTPVESQPKPTQVFRKPIPCLSASFGTVSLVV